MSRVAWRVSRILATARSRWRRCVGRIAAGPPAENLNGACLPIGLVAAGAEFLGLLAGLAYHEGCRLAGLLPIQTPAEYQAGTFELVWGHGTLAFFRTAVGEAVGSLGRLEGKRVGGECDRALAGGEDAGDV